MLLNIFLWHFNFILLFIICFLYYNIGSKTDFSSLVLCYRPTIEMVPEPEWGCNKYYWLKNNAWGLDMGFLLFLSLSSYSLPTSISPISVHSTVLGLWHQQNGGFGNQDRIWKCLFYPSLKHSGPEDSPLLATWVGFKIGINSTIFVFLLETLKPVFPKQGPQLIHLYLHLIPYITIFTTSQVSILFHIMKYECLLLSLASKQYVIF